MNLWDWVVIGGLVSIAVSLLIGEFVKAGRGLRADDVVNHPDWPREPHTTLGRGPESPRAHRRGAEARRLERVK